MKAKALKSNPQLKAVSGGEAPGKFYDHKLMGVNPLKKQFEPTDAAPTRPS